MSKAAPPLSYAAKAKQTAAAQQQSAASSRVPSPAASQPATPASQAQQNGSSQTTNATKHASSGSISAVPAKPVVASYSSVAVPKASEASNKESTPASSTPASNSTSTPSLLSTASKAPATTASTPAAPQVNGTAATIPSTTKAPLPKIDFNSFFQSSSGSTSNPPSPPAPSNASTLDDGRRSVSTYDPTTSRPPHQSISPMPAPFQSNLTGSARTFSPSPSAALSPTFHPNQPYNSFHPSSSHGPGSKSPNANSGFANNYNNSGPNSRQGQSGYNSNRNSISGGPPRNYANGPTSPRMPNGQLPNQPYAYPPPAGSQNWQQQPYGYQGYGQYYGAPPFVPQQSGQANLNASNGPPSLQRNPSSGMLASSNSQHSGSPQPTSNTLMSSTTSSVSGWQPSSTGPSTPAPSTPSMQSSNLPSNVSTPSSSFRPGAAAFNPTAHEFSPNPSIFRPAQSKAILIRKPPATPTKEKPAAPSSVSTPSVADKAAQDEAEAKKAKDEQEAKDKAKAEEEAASKAKAKAEKVAAEEKEAAEKKAAEEKAKSEAEAQEKAKAEEAERVAREKSEQEQKEKEQKAAEDKAKAEQEAKDKAAAEQAKLVAEEAASKKAEEERRAAEAVVAEANAKEQASNEATAKALAETKASESAEPTPGASQSSTRPASPEPTTPADTSRRASIDSDNEKKRAALPQPLELAKKSGGHSRQLSTDSRPVSNAALRSAKSIADLKTIEYPDTISSPELALNANAQPGKFRYDRDFLMQFMTICRERPEQLPSLEAIGMSDADGSAYTPASGSAPGTPRLPPYGNVGGSNRRTTSQSGTARGAAPPRIGQQFPAMGQFGAPAAQLSSAERYQQSLANAPMGGGFPGRPGGMMRQPSAGPLKAMGSMSGMGRSNDRRSGKGSQRRPDHSRQASQMVLSGEYVEPLQTTDNAWTPNVGAAAAGKQVDTNAPEYVQRKVKALLNKLTMEKFDSISNQILEWANKSEYETDGFTLRQVIALIFEKATDEAQWSEMYARLCRKIQEVLSPNVRDSSLGDSVSGGSLFRKYLLNRCQEDYEKGWTEKQQAATAAAAKATDDAAKQAANEKAKEEAEKGEESSQNKEAEMMSDEYYIAQKAKRRGLGLVRFIGELYKLNMLTARIMRECVQKLLSNVTDPEEEDMEALVRLLTTVGKQLEDDNPSKTEQGLQKSRGLMSVYFERLILIRDNKAVPSRIQFMVQDLIDMRKAGWKGKPGVGGPKTIAEIHKDAKQAEVEAARRTASSGGRLPTMSQQMGGRPQSRRGQPRDVGPDGWQAVGSAAPAPVRPRQAGDLSAFGKVRGSQTGSERILGAGNSVFNRKNQPRQAEAAAEVPRQQNAFAALAADSGEATETSSERPKIQLLARTKPLEGEEDATEELEAAEEAEVEGEDEEEEEEGDEEEPEMSEENIQRSIKNSVAEYFAVRNLDEGVETFKTLPSAARHRLATALGSAAIEKKEADAKLVALLYTTILSQEVMSTDDFFEGMKPLVKTLADVATDAPKAYTYAAMLLKGAGLSEEQVKTLSQSMESEDEEVEEAQERLLGEFIKQA